MIRNSNIKIVFIDIDGTLTNSDKIITPNTINTLNKLNDNGIEVVICSGRGNSYVTNLLKNVYTPKYSISSNGAEIYDHQNKTNLFTSKIDFNTILNVYNYVNENNLEIILNTEKTRYVNFNAVYKKDTVLIDNINNLKNLNIYQIIIADKEYSKMKELKNYLNTYKNIYIINHSHDYMNKVIEGDHWFDIVNININKGDAVKLLLKKLNIDKKYSICFGDSINDFDMFDACGIKVAMGNALDSLKEKADYITESNDNDGITYFFKTQKTDEK